MNPSNASGFRLLIVDDNDSIHADLKKILNPARNDSALLDDESLLFGTQATASVGFQIDSAFQGQEGLAMVQAALAQQQPYALAYIDVRMPPGWDGIETIRHIWKVDPELQVVICTAYSDYNWQDIERNLGRSHNLVILKKPFDPIEVLQLAHALTAKWEAARLAHMRMEEMDRLVEERTAQLLSTVRELDEARAQAERRALEDPLTHLPNRRLFMRRLSASLQRSRSVRNYNCAVLFLDLDRFKIINDSLGHLAGDELLIDIAARLRASLREGAGRMGTEDVIARLGGDEFAILLDGIRDAEDAEAISHRVQDSLTTPFNLRGSEVCCTVSIGIVTSQSCYEDSDTMMRDADTAMYHAKENGGGVYKLFDESMHSSTIERLHKEVEIRQALERNEFHLAYQPIVSLVSGEVEGVEALLRWESPTRGRVDPADFISVSEETGLIVPLGAWVIEEACRQIRAWRLRYGLAFQRTVSVNISARQFLQPSLVATVEQAMKQAAINSNNLRLELTETVTMQDPRQAENMLSQLQRLGVRLSIDDFGTGYSSLNYLHRFSVDTLKIDQSFIADMMENERSLNIVRTIVTLAHNLRMAVIAEGVETAEQAALLMKMRCDSAQGYYFSRPTRAEHLEPAIERIGVLMRTLKAPSAIPIPA